MKTWSRTVVEERAARFAREIAVSCAALVVLGTATATGRAEPAPAEGPVLAVSAAVEQPLLEVPPRDRPSLAPEARPGAAEPPAPAPAAAPAPAPAAAPPAPRPAPAAPPAPAPARWLPSGTGMWLHDWNGSEGGDPAAVVARAQASGLSHLFVQTGSTKKGWIGEEVLSELLPVAGAAGIAVVAWDFPKLLDPEADAHRMADAALFSRPGAPRVAAVAPDVETAAEGTRISADAVDRYYRALRAHLPPDVAILATVPWPSEKRVGKYPYDATAPYTDAWIPMAYWYNRSPAEVTASSMFFLGRYGKPVMPVGQGYDGRIDAPYLPEDPAPDRSVQLFVDTAKAHGATSVSLWSWQTTGGPQWDVLARSAPLFPRTP